MSDLRIGEIIRDLGIEVGVPIENSTVNAVLEKALESHRELKKEVEWLRRLMGDFSGHNYIDVPIVTEFDVIDPKSEP